MSALDVFMWTSDSFTRLVTLTRMLTARLPIESLLLASCSEDARDESEKTRAHKIGSDRVLRQ